ncbi:MAG: hypothetical protein PHQ57_03640 [Candidatus Omnitrophica bacterium]|nr:hypothetical protein [Candidatus Omnitrophota bacterium]
MRLSRFLLTSSLITFLCILYVFQQTEILRMAYVGQKKRVAFDDLLDKNSILRYNINKDASLVQIGDSIAKCSDYEMPNSYRLVKFVSNKGNLRAGTQAVNKENLLSRLFGIKRQAEAKTINP